MLISLLYAQSLDYEIQPGESDFTEYRDQKLDVEQQLSDIERNLDELSGQSFSNLNRDGVYDYREPVAPSQSLYQDDDINGSGIKHSKVINTWDQTPSGVDEEVTGLKRAGSVGLREEYPQRNQKSELKDVRNKLNKAHDHSLRERPGKYSSRDRGFRKFNRVNQNKQKFIEEKDPRAFKPKRDIPYDQLMSSLIDNWMRVTGLIEDDNQQSRDISINSGQEEKNVTNQPEPESNGGQKEESLPPNQPLYTVVPQPLYTITPPPKIVPPTAMTMPSTVATMAPPPNIQPDITTTSPCQKVITTTLEPPKNSTSFMQKVKNVFKKIFNKKKDDDSKPPEELTDEEADLIESLLSSKDQFDEVSLVEGKNKLTDVFQGSEEQEEQSVNELKQDSPIAPKVKNHKLNDSNLKSSNLTVAEVSLLEDFSDSDLSFLKNLISCMKKSSPELSRTEHDRNRTTLVTKKPKELENIKKKNTTLTKEVSHLSFNPGNVSNSYNITQDMLKHQTFTKNFTQFVIECQPIVVNYSNVSGQQFLSFNCKNFYLFACNTRRTRALKGLNLMVFRNF